MRLGIANLVDELRELVLKLGRDRCDLFLNWSLNFAETVVIYFLNNHSRLLPLIQLAHNIYGPVSTPLVDPIVSNFEGMGQGEASRQKRVVEPFQDLAIANRPQSLP